jgi:putative ABC transport system permease protein
MIPRFRRTWRTLWRSTHVEADMRDEMRLHIDMEAERLQAMGLAPDEARRQAYLRFGGVEKFKEEGREARGFAWVDSLSLDARLGVRMLAKHRWLTVVGGIAMAVAIAIGASAFEIISVLLREDLPLPGGERIVAVRYASGEERVLHAFTAWRGQVRTIEHLGAFRMAQHNLVAPNAPPEPVPVAEISASAFVLAGTPPLHGRYLLPSDEQDQAAPALVLGYDPWRRKFDADPGIVGRAIPVGGVPTTIVGIMPDGFAFPVNQQYWMPLRLDPLKWRVWEGPSLEVFGRLAPGVSAQQAQAELAGVGRQVADAHPEGAGRLQPIVQSYTRANSDLDAPAMVWMMRAAQFLVGALSCLVAINLAILLYARTITRLGEIAVRTALGASRGRILSQLFVEALVLTTLGAAAGLMISNYALKQVEAVAGNAVPFWWRYSPGPDTMLYTFVLAVVAAFIMGVLPGRKATGQRLSANLQELHGRGGTRLGSMWTTMIVAQVAVAVAILPAAVFLTWYGLRLEFAGRSPVLDQIVVANMVLGTDQGEPLGLVRQRQDALMARLTAEPGVRTVTFSSALPGLGPDRTIEFEPSAPVRDASSLEVATFRIDVGLLRAYDARLLAGREFEARDVTDGRVAIVNRTFVNDLLEPSASALGTRFRYAAVRDGSAPSEWFEIIGVVDDFPPLPRSPESPSEPSAYHPMASGTANPPVLSIRFASPPPANVAERVREIAAELDPELQMRRVVPLSAFYEEQRAAYRGIALAVALVTAAVLLLSAAGVHAMMSFTIAQRTREIGIRSALGAQPRHLLFGIFRGTLRQLAFGIAAGSLLSVGVFVAVGSSMSVAVALLVTVAIVMAVVAAIAAIGPARRILRIQTVEALRVEG